MSCPDCNGTGDSPSGDPTRHCVKCQGRGELEEPCPVTCTVRSHQHGGLEKDELEVSVTLERSIGTASGHEDIIPKLRRALEKQLATFCLGRGLKGKWSIVAYVSREET